jgi:hypothetical protein
MQKAIDDAIEIKINHISRKPKEPMEELLLYTKRPQTLPGLAN